MSKTLRTISIDTEIDTLASTKIKNISSFCNEALRLELELLDSNKRKTEKEVFEELKIKNASLMAEVTRLKEEIKNKKSEQIEDVRRLF